MSKSHRKYVIRSPHGYDCVNPNIPDNLSRQHQLKKLPNKFVAAYTKKCNWDPVSTPIVTGSSHV